MIIKLALRITRIANFFPAKGGISRHYPTATIVTGKQIDFNKELVYSFGDYVQAYYESRPKNNNLPRTKGCIYLQSTDTLQRGHELMDLSTGELIRCTRVDKCVMTQLVIDRVEELAVKQGYRTLKFFNRKNQELVLRDVDLLENEVTSNETISDDPGFLNLPSDEGAPGGLLNELEEDLDVDEGIDPSELADLLADAAEDPRLGA